MFLTTFHRLNSEKYTLALLQPYKPEFTQTHNTQINIAKKEQLKKILAQSKSGK